MGISKQAQKKIDHGFKKEGPRCGNCFHVAFNVRIDPFGYRHKSDLRCIVGDFATNTNGWCKMYRHAAIVGGE